MKLRKLEVSDRYKNFISFRNSSESRLILRNIFWSSVVVIFLVVHFPKDKIYNLILPLLQSLPESVFQALFHKTDPQFIAAQYMAGGIVNKLFVPLKEVLFYLALLVILSTAVKAVWRERDFWYQLETRKIAISALSIFLILALLVFPGGANSENFGLVGMGTEYARMSANPFAENTGWYYRRLLKPAIAHLLHLDAPFPYYILSLFGSYTLIFMMIILVESKIKLSQNNEDAINNRLGFKESYLYYLSIATSSYFITDFLWPGYADHLSFILIFLMACIPMNQQERLGIVALCLVNHEASAFSLLPIILFCFPKSERKPAFLLLAIYFGIWVASYGLNVNSALAPNIVRKDKSSSLQLLIENFDYAIAGTFFAYKFFWLILLYGALRLWSQKDISALVAISSMVLFPIFIMPIAWDTTRLIGLGCLGMLIILAILISEYQKLPKIVQRFLLVIASLNLIIPSYSVVLESRESFSDFFYPGLYNLLVEKLKHFMQ